MNTSLDELQAELTKVSAERERAFVVLYGFVQSGMIHKENKANFLKTVPGLAEWVANNYTD